MEEIPSKDIVNYALETCHTEIHNAILSLIFTTGLHKDIVRNITINDLVGSADMAFEDGEPHTVNSLISKDEKDLFLCWTFEKDAKHQVIFSSPSTSRYILKYLKNIEKFHDLNGADELFQTKSKKTKEFGQITDNFISQMFNNKKNMLRKYKNVPEGLKFTPVSFQSHFKKVCEDHLSLNELDKKELTDLFVGEANEDNEYYKKFKNDKLSILKYYKQLLPHIEVEYFDVNKYIINPTIEDNPPNDYSDSEWDIKIKITSYYTDNIKEGRTDYNECDMLCGIVYDLVLQDRDSKHRTFILNDESLDNYFKKAKVQILIEDYAEKIFIEVTNDNLSIKIDEIKQLIKEIGICYVVYIDENHLDNVLKEYLSYQLDCNCYELIVTSSSIKYIVFLCIDGFFNV